jgi:penicillin-binding protein 1C
VPAKRAIARYLNIPAVRMLQEYRVERLHYLLRKLGLNTIKYNPEHYGLSLILGGAEATLWDLAGVYASMARTLSHFRKYSGRYDKGDFHAPTYVFNELPKQDNTLLAGKNSFLNASAIWQTFEAMVEVSRPDEESSWTEFSSLGKVAWKTGTSFGSRDAWAIGTTPKYVVAIWVGNASGEGRPGLTGIGTAGPILFDIFNLLKAGTWFDMPYDEMTKIPVCKRSGHRISDICNEVDTMWVANSGLKSPPCPYHKIAHLDNTGKWQVTDDCESLGNMIHTPWFVLPPIQEWYYKSKTPDYKILPPFKPGCGTQVAKKTMDLIYPKNGAKIFVLVEITGIKGKTIFEATHSNPNATIYWHLNNEYIAATKQFHQLQINPLPGQGYRMNNNW